MTITRLLFIILIINAFLISNELREENIIDQADKNKIVSEEKLIRHLNSGNSWFTGLLIMWTVWGAYLCFLFFALFVFVLVVVTAGKVQEKDKDKDIYNIEFCKKFKAIYLFMTK